MTTIEKRQRGRPRLVQGPGEAASVQSLDRAVGLLTIVARGSGLSLTEAAAAAELAPSTAYRMLSTLQRHGLVEFEPDGQLWHVGVEAFRIGSAFLRRRKIADRSRAVMQALVDRCGETANLAVAEDRSVVFVGQIETHEPIRAFFRPGTRSPFHASGVGKAILAHLPEARLRDILAREPLTAFTGKTLADENGLLADLDAIRARGYAVDDEERHLGMRCLAAPIFNEFGEPVAGVSISGPSVRMTDARIAEFGPLVVEAAAGITESIAGRPPGGSEDLAA